MTRREWSKDAVLCSLAGLADSRSARVREILAEDPRSSFTMEYADAASLREILEIKYRNAKNGGIIVDGDTEFLLALSDLGGDELVTVVVSESGNEFAVAYFRLSTQTAIGCIIVRS